MSSGGVLNEKEGLPPGEHVDILKADVLATPELMNDAFDGENREHEERIWASVKSHPWACLWAFIMCFTIVSLHSR